MKQNFFFKFLGVVLIFSFVTLILQISYEERTSFHSLERKPIQNINPYPPSPPYLYSSPSTDNNFDRNDFPDSAAFEFSTSGIQLPEIKKKGVFCRFNSDNKKFFKSCVNIKPQCVGKPKV